MTNDHLQDEGSDSGGDDLVRDSSMALMRVVPLLANPPMNILLYVWTSWNAREG